MAFYEVVCAFSLKWKVTKLEAWLLKGMAVSHSTLLFLFCLSKKGTQKRTPRTPTGLGRFRTRQPEQRPGLRIFQKEERNKDKEFTLSLPLVRLWREGWTSTRFWLGFAEIERLLFVEAMKNMRRPSGSFYGLMLYSINIRHPSGSRDKRKFI